MRGIGNSEWFRLTSEWAELRALEDIDELDTEVQRTRLAQLERMPTLAHHVHEQQAAVTNLLAEEALVDRNNAQFVERVWGHVRQLPPKLRVVGDGAELHEDTCQLKARHERLPSFREIRLGRAVGAGAFAGALMAALWFFYGHGSDEQAADGAVPPPPLARVTYTSGVTRVASQLEQGAVLVTEAGQVCVEPAPGVDVCLGSNGHVRFERLTAKRHVLRLLAGQVAVALDDRPRDLQLSVVVGDTRATATGTVFAVSASKEPRVSVLRGTVRVDRFAGGSERQTGAALPKQAQAVGREQSVVSSEATGLTLVESSATEQVAAWRLLEPTNLWRRSAVTPPQAFSELLVKAPSAVDVRVDGIELGRTPVHVVLAPGLHRVAFVDPESDQTEVREIELASGRSATVTFEAPVLAKPSPDDTVQSKPAPTPQPAPAQRADVSAEQLLRQARREVASGSWNTAAAKYRELRRRFPASTEARTVLVALGDIQRLRLGNPAAALRSYQTYLQAGGALAQEARSGKARALRTLGRTAEERQALRQYLRAHPEGVEAQAFRKRLEALQ